MGNALTTLNFQEFDKLWNQGKFGEARQLLYGMNSHGHGSRDVQYWLKRAMAELMFNNYSEAEYCMKDARTCRGWQPFYENNYQRDLALASIRDRDIQLSTSTVQLMLEPMTVSNDLNDQACARMIMGRYHYERAYRTYGREQRKLLDEALANFERAEATWDGMDKGVNEQWWMNNNYHWFKALRLSRDAKAIAWGYNQSDTCLTELYFRVQRDPSKKRRRAARLILFTGRFGLWLERRVP